jgi:hypothetical protein
MNIAQIKHSLTLCVFGIIGFGPVPPGCLIGIYILIFRPPWCWNLIQALYLGMSFEDDRKVDRLTRLKTLMVLITLLNIDILLYPVTPSIAFPIILFRPTWFFMGDP